MTDSGTQVGDDGLLERAYHLTGGDTHKPVDLQCAGRELGLSIKQIRLLLCSLVEQGYLLLSPSDDPGKMALYLTQKAVKKMASIKTRR